MFPIAIALGSNLGNRRQNLTNAVGELEKEGCIVEAASAVYETEPAGYSSEHDFLNQVAVVSSRLEPRELLNRLLVIEQRMGRKRNEAGIVSDRIIDLDLLLYENIVINTTHLILPHPRMASRNFVLVPLAEVLPGWEHPLLRVPVSRMLEQSTDRSSVRRLES